MNIFEINSFLAIANTFVLLPYQIRNRCQISWPTELFSHMLGLMMAIGHLFARLLIDPPFVSCALWGDRFTNRAFLFILPVLLGGSAKEMKIVWLIPLLGLLEAFLPFRDEGDYKDIYSVLCMSIGVGRHDHVLPYYLGLIENLRYPKDRIRITFYSDNSRRGDGDQADQIIKR